MSGESVRLIQNAINRLAPCQPRLWRLNEDGSFGPMTRDAVFTFQSLFGMAIDGVVGPATWDRLMREAAACSGGGVVPPTPPTPPTPPPVPPFPGTNLQMGSRGESVRLVQNAINRLVPCQPRLWQLNEDGSFGPMTRDAIFTFQSAYGLAVNGIVGDADIIRPTR